MYSYFIYNFINTFWKTTFCICILQLYRQGEGWNISCWKSQYLTISLNAFFSTWKCHIPVCTVLCNICVSLHYWGEVQRNCNYCKLWVKPKCQIYLIWNVIGIYKDVRFSGQCAWSRWKELTVTTDSNLILINTQGPYK